MLFLLQNVLAGVQRSAIFGLVRLIYRQEARNKEVTMAMYVIEVQYDL